MVLYRDVGLVVAKKHSGPEIDRARKMIHKIFNDNGLKIDIKGNLKVVDFLDITFNLNNGTYKPYVKPNNAPLYVHTKSNHPPHVLKQIPTSISKRISNISSNEGIFKKAAPYYNKALKEAGHEETLSYCPTNTSQKKNRPRKIIWFVPPFSKNVSTNVARTFLNLVKKHFPPCGKFSKLFNKNNVKVSYSCMPNISRVIKSHNSKILNCTDTVSPHCNCRGKNRNENCPLPGRCTIENIVYSAKVSTGTDKESKVYLGASGPPLNLDIPITIPPLAIQTTEKTQAFLHMFGTAKTLVKTPSSSNGLL